MFKVTRSLDDNKRRLFIFSAAIWETAYGAAYLFMPMAAIKQRGFGWMPFGINENELSWIWIIAGVIAGVISLYHKRVTRYENFAFGVLILPASVWSIIYLISFAIGNNENGLFHAFQFSWFWMVLYVSGWPNPISARLQVEGT